MEAKTDVDRDRQRLGLEVNTLQNQVKARFTAMGAGGGAGGAGGAGLGGVRASAEVLREELARARNLEGLQGALTEAEETTKTMHSQLSEMKFELDKVRQRFIILYSV